MLELAVVWLPLVQKISFTAIGIPSREPFSSFSYHHLSKSDLIDYGLSYIDDIGNTKNYIWFRRGSNIIAINSFTGKFVKISESDKDSGGLILILDEMGKFLEHAAAEKDQDIYFFQELAELASNRNIWYQEIMRSMGA